MTRPTGPTHGTNRRPGASLLRRLGLPVIVSLAVAATMIAALVAVAQPSLAGGSAVSYVGRAASGTSATKGTTTGLTVGAKGIAAGDALIVSVLLSSTAGQTGTVTATDAAGNAYRIDKDQNDAKGGDRALVLSAHSAIALAPGSVITVTYPSSYEFHATVDEFAGIGAADTSAGAFMTGAAYSSGAAAAAAGELVFGAVGAESGANPPTVAAGWTGLPTMAIGRDYLGTGYQISGTAGTSAFSGTVGGTWMAMAVAYSATGPVLPPTSPVPSSSTTVSIVPTTTLSSTAATTTSGTAASTTTAPTGSATATSVPPTTQPPGGSGSGADVGPIGSVTSGTAATGATIGVGSGGVAAGDGIVISVLLSSTKTGTVAASDSAGNLYAVDKTQADGTGGDLLVILSAHGVKALPPGGSIMVAFPSSSEHHVAAEEFSGLGAVDKTASAFATGAGFASGAALATAGEIVFGTVGAENALATPLFAAPWHPLATLAVSSDYLGTAYQVAGSSASFNAAGTSGGTWMAAAVSYRAAGGSGGPTSTPPATATSTTVPPSTYTPSATVPATTTTVPPSTYTPSATVPATTTTVPPTRSTFLAYGGYMDTHHSGTTNPKPDPWQGSANSVFSGQADSSAGGWDGSAVRIDNTSTATETITLTVDIGSSHFALWGTVTVPAGYSLIATQQGNASFDGSDTNPAGCYGCNPTLCQTAVSSTIPVVHVIVDGVKTDVPDVAQILNTKGADSAGCPYTGTRNDESQTWTRLT